MGTIPFRSSSFAIFVIWSLSLNVLLAEDASTLVPRECRRTVASTEFGAITAVDVKDRERGPYQLQFITLDPGSLFLPVILHTDMVFYVHTGEGTVSWITGHDDSNSIEVKRGDIYRIEEGSVFYVQSHSNQEREKLRIHAIFTIDSSSESRVGAYSNISDLVRGFDDKVLQMGFAASEEVVEEIKSAERPPPIVRLQPKNDTDESNWTEGIFEALIGRKYPVSLVDNGKKKKKSKTKTFNLYDRKPDVKNCNGWSIAVTSRDFKILRDSDIGVFMVNLTRGAMMGPHWNPRATEIAMVVHGEGMVQIVCPSNLSGERDGQFECKNASFKVKEGDIFVVPRLHPMAQIAFNDGSFVFVGFTTMAGRNHPQFLAGEWSVLRVIDREVLALAFNTVNATLDPFLNSQKESVMLDCTSCAEELERKIEEEMARKREEEEAKRRQEEEEAKRREEEEARKRQEEDEAKRRKEEEEAKKREEEQEEARRREEEEAIKRREEEEAKRKEEEEEARKREEEQEEARREEEEAARKRQEEEEAKRREEEEEARKRKEEQEKARREEEEEAARKKQEEEETRRMEEEEERREEEARRREEDQEEAKRKKDEEARREEEEAREREEAAKRREEEKETRREEEEEAARRREEEDAKTRREEEEVKEGEGEEEEVRRQEDKKEEARRKEEEKETRRREEEEVRREEEEVDARGREEEEVRRIEAEAARKFEEEARKREQEGQGQKEEVARSRGVEMQTQQKEALKQEEEEGKRGETQQPMEKNWKE